MQKPKMAGDQPTIASVTYAKNVEIDELRDQLRERDREYGELRKDAAEWRTKAEAAATRAIKAADDHAAEVNGLRDALLGATLGLERMRGYIDGLDDARPPVMVPERRVLHRGERAEEEPMIFNHDDAQRRWQRLQTKEWYHK